RRRRMAWAFAATLVLASPAMASDALYDDLGGDAGIGAIIEAFLFRLADDTRINAHFIDTDVIRFRDKLVELVCELSGGPCVYSGDTMKLTHAGMAIDHADFNAVVENLIEAMSGLDVATGVQNRLLARLAPLHADIIER
ncbi:MAG: group 1 truncated hemoglobin, partial [Gammaproteobacteria bacterium]